MWHPSKQAFQSIHVQYDFPIIPNFVYPFKKDKHQFCDKSLSLGISEFPHKISMDNDVSQGLIYVWDIVKERVKDHYLSRIKIRPDFGICDLILTKMKYIIIG